MSSNVQCDPLALSEYSCDMLEGAEAAVMAEHLKGCSSCREQLEALRLLDGLLLRSGEGPAPETLDTTYARARQEAIQSRDAGLKRLESRGRFSRRSSAWLTAAAGLAAAILLVFVHLPAPEESALEDSPRLVAKGQTMPGSESQITLLPEGELLPPALSFSVLDASGTLSRGRRDERYPSSAQLYFRVDLPASGQLLLLHVYDGRLEPLMPMRQGPESLAVQKGAWELAEGAQLLSLPLAGMAGTHRFMVLSANRPFGLSAPLRDAVLSGLDATSIYRVFGLRSDGFQIQVQDEPLR